MPLRPGTTTGQLGRMPVWLGNAIGTGGSRIAAVAGLAALVAVAPPIAAQRIAGTVVLPDSVTRAARVLVEVRIGARAPVRLLTNDAGTFGVPAPPGDTVRLRVLRPGFRPVVAPPVVLAAGETRAVRIVLTAEPVTIAAVRVRESRVCGERADAAAWQLWEQARTVLQSIELTERDTAIRVWTVEFQGETTPGSAVVVKDSTILDVPVEPPFPPVYYDSLFRLGYIRRVGDTTTYYAPNATVLADPRFVEGYCFRVAEADSTPEGLVGVRFEPQRRRWGAYADIAGTFWLDRETFLLRQIEFAYVNPPANHRVPGIGGYVLFTKLASGHWIMHEWMIRMGGVVWTRGPRQRLRRADGTYFMERNGVIPQEGFAVRGDLGLWARSRIVYRVQLDETTLLYDAQADALSRRAIPRPPPAR